MSTTIFEELVNSSLDGIFAFDRECCYTVWNPAMERLFGAARDQVIGKPMFEVFPFLKEIGEDKYYEAALEGQDVVARDRPFADPHTGQTRFYTAHYSPLRTEIGEVIGGMAIVRDITERKRMFDELAVLGTVSQTVSSTLNFKEILDLIIEHITRLLKAAVTSVALCDESRGDLYFATAYGQNASFIVGRRLQLGQGIAGWVAQHGEPLLIPDASKEPRFYRTFNRLGGFATRSILCVPLQIKGQTIGVIEALNKQEGDFTQDDLRLLLLLAAPMAQAIENGRLYEQAQRELAERKRVEQALRQSEARYRHLFEDSPISLWEENFSAVKTYLDDLRQRENIRDFKAYFDRHPDVVTHCASLIKVLDVNRVTLKIFKARAKAELIGNLNRVLGPGSFEAMKEQLATIAEGGIWYEAETVDYTLDGRKIDVLLSWLVTPGYEDTYENVVVSLIDITARKRAEAELNAYREHLETLVKERTAELERSIAETAAARDRIDAILHSVMDGLIVTDLNRRVILANPAAETLLGVSMEQIIGREVETVIVDDRLRQAVIRTLDQQSSVRDVEVKLEAALQGRPRVVRVSTAPVGGGNGPLGMVTMIQDVTRLHEVNRLKSELIKTVAHELRTPLTGILGFSEILLTRQLDYQRQRRYLLMIHEQSAALSKIVDDLLDIARLESGRPLELNLEQVDMAKLMQEVIMPFAETAHEYNIEVEGIENLPAIIGDRFRLAQVGRNLLANAVKYSKPGGTICVRGRVIPGFLEISIQDTGIGMTSEQQHYLFEPFYRGDTSDTAVGGAGLGLAISKMIIEQHGGKIWLESEWQKGTTVYFTLPLVQHQPGDESPDDIVLQNE